MISDQARRSLPCKTNATGSTRFGVFSCIYPAIFLVLKHCRRHSPESWKELWERLIFPASRLEQHGGGGDEVRVWVTAGFQADQKLGPNDRSRQLQWSVVII